MSPTAQFKKKCLEVKARKLETTQKKLLHVSLSLKLGRWKSVTMVSLSHNWSPWWYRVTQRDRWTFLVSTHCVFRSQGWWKVYMRHIQEWLLLLKQIWIWHRLFVHCPRFWERPEMHYSSRWISARVLRLLPEQNWALLQTGGNGDCKPNSKRQAYNTIYDTHKIIF